MMFDEIDPEYEGEIKDRDSLVDFIAYEIDNKYSAKVTKNFPDYSENMDLRFDFDVVGVGGDDIDAEKPETKYLHLNMYINKSTAINNFVEREYNNQTLDKIADTIISILNHAENPTFKPLILEVIGFRAYLKYITS